MAYTCIILLIIILQLKCSFFFTVKSAFNDLILEIVVCVLKKEVLLKNEVNSFFVLLPLLDRISFSMIVLTVLLRLLFLGHSRAF